MAPEAIEKKISIEANDSWAFSVLIFEVFHRGFGPYHEYDPEDKVVDLLKKRRATHVPIRSSQGRNPSSWNNGQYQKVESVS
ncbi:hypothetical protein L3Y34_009231 [Caenorhabditis briggsae]|uniref:Protein kinase domain-containing protein n=1 Tax=Caenorhabditis briggsae TaxID=6238 RepID=A0AAE9A9Q2_CAEBR|nr:hypothetical protein L3Y34_009231 [Caenorhabditis briggsae]